jgi:hypothetical protein
VTLRATKGTAGSDRVELIWPDNTIQNQWLQITVKADTNTGLAAPDVFYFGNLMGDATYNGVVTGSDVSNIKATVSTSATLASPTDLNRNATITGSDVSLAKLSVGASLPMITALATAPAVAEPATSQATPQARRPSIGRTPGVPAIRLAKRRPSIQYAIPMTLPKAFVQKSIKPQRIWDRALADRAAVLLD